MKTPPAEPAPLSQNSPPKAVRPVLQRTSSSTAPTPSAAARLFSTPRLCASDIAAEQRTTCDVTGVAYGDRMAEIKTVHIWMLDGRALCDRRPYPSHLNETEEQYEASKREAAMAPACGACLLLAGRIRREAAAILERHPVVHPAKASEAWESLRETRWNSYFNLDAFKESADHVNENTKFDAMKDPMYPNTVSELVEQWDEEILKTGISRDELGGKSTPGAL